MQHKTVLVKTDTVDAECEACGYQEQKMKIMKYEAYSTFSWLCFTSVDTDLVRIHTKQHPTPQLVVYG